MLDIDVPLCTQTIFTLITVTLNVLNQNRKPGFMHYFYSFLFQCSIFKLYDLILVYKITFNSSFSLP